MALLASVLLVYQTHATRGMGKGDREAALLLLDDGAAAAGNANAAATEKHRTLSQLCLYVCPEPILAKDRFA